MTHEEIVRRIMINIGSVNVQNNQAWSESQIEAFGNGLEATLITYRAQVLEKVEALLIKEHYGISYETDKCIECSNHDRIKEALKVIHPTN